MKKSTRLMGALLALIFVFALLPVSAFAAEPELITADEPVVNAEPTTDPANEPTADPEITTNPESGTDPVPVAKPEFEATTESKGILKNVAGMEYRVGETGDYTPVPEGKSEVEVEFGTNITVKSFVVCVRPAGSTDEANVTKINVGRMGNPDDYIKETVPPTTIDGSDGKIIFKEEVKVKFGEEGSPMQEMTVTEIGGLGWRKIYNVKMAANGNMLGSIETLGVGFDNFTDQATVTFAAGDHGEGEMEPVKVTAGNTIDVPECKFTAVNADNVKYEFNGWEVTGKFEKTEDGKYIINGDTTFTALWKEVKEPVMVNITLTFDYNDGSGKTSSETKTVEEGTNAEFTLPEAPYQRDEHDFQGWEVAGTVFKAGDKVYNSVDATAKAVWKEREPLHYVLRFDANGGTGAPEPQDMGMSKRREVRLTVTDTVPTKDGMKFLGWSLHKGTEVVLEPGDICLLNEKFPDLTVYAVWVDPAAAPKTGDESNVALWASIAAVSLVAIAGAVFFILKKNKKTDDDDQIDTME